MNYRKRGTQSYSQWVGPTLQLLSGDTGPGAHYFVDSVNGSDTYSGKSWSAAKATIDAAVDLCTACEADTIWVSPYHAENLAADSAVDVDLIGTSIIGIRQGRKMPTLTATAATGDFKLAAAGCSVTNIRFSGGIDTTTGILEVSAADCAIIDCEYIDTVGQATDVIMTTADADRLLIEGWRHYGAAADTADTSIVLIGCDDTEIRKCYFYGNFDLGAIEARTTAVVRAWIHDCVFWTAGAEDLCILDTVTASTGIIGPNIHCVLADDAANVTEAVTGATWRLVGLVDVVNADDEKALAINWTASA